jgi:hypothetical protein
MSVVDINPMTVISGLIVVVVIIADYGACRVQLSEERTSISQKIVAGIQLPATRLERKLRSLAGRSIASIRFLLITMTLSGLFLMSGLIVSNSLELSLLTAKFSPFLLPSLIATWFAVICSYSVTARLRSAETALTLCLWLLLWCLIPFALWLGVMHFGTWLEWRESRSPLEFASEWFYAQVYDDYFRNPAGFAITTAIALAVSLPVIIPLTWICSRAIIVTANLKRGILGFVALAVFVILQVAN